MWAVAATIRTPGSGATLVMSIRTSRDSPVTSSSGSTDAGSTVAASTSSPLAVRPCATEVSTG